MKQENTCKHFNGTINPLCAAGVNYREHVGGPDFGWGVRLPCLVTERSHDVVPCELRDLPTAEEVAEYERRLRERLAQFARDLADGNCPHCHQKMTKRQVGRCVYAEPCGHRLYQGRVR